MSTLQMHENILLNQQEKKRKSVMKWMKILYIPNILLLICDIIIIFVLLQTKDKNLDNLFWSTGFSVFLILSFIWFVIILLVWGIIFLQWFYRAYKNLQVANIKNQHRPSMAIWWCIIPIINLWYPFRIMQELAVKMSEYIEIESSSIRNTIYYWWAFFVSGIMLARQAYKMPEDTYEHVLIWWWLDLASRLAWIFCTFMLLRILVQMNFIENKFLEKTFLTNKSCNTL